MLLSRPVGSPEFWGLGAVPFVNPPKPPVIGSGTSSGEVWEFRPPPTGYVRGDILYAVNQYRGRLKAISNTVISALTAQHAAGQLPNCRVAVPPCAPGSGFETCRWPLIESCHQAKHDVGRDRFATVPGQDYTEPIGVFVRFGVAFPIDALKKGNKTHPGEPTIESTFTPTPDQRWQMDHAIYVKSQIDLAEAHWGVDLTERTNLQYLLADHDHSKGFLGLLTRTHASLQQLIDEVKQDGQPVFTTRLENFSLNPITPTDDELHDRDGAYNYYKRGGFLLSRNAAFGREPVAKGELAYNSGYCWVQDVEDCGRHTAVMLPSPRPIPMRDSFPGENRGRWATFVTIGPQYTIRVQAYDKTGLGGVADWLGNVLRRLPGVLCTSAPTLAAWNSSTLLAETCVDRRTGEPCTKGSSKDCICTPPTNGQQAMVAAANVGMQMWCGKFTPTVPIAPPPPMPEPVETFPWHWVILGGGFAAAMLLLRK